MSMRAEGQHQAGLCSSEMPEHLPCARDTPGLKNLQGASPRGAAQTQAVPAMENTTFISFLQEWDGILAGLEAKAAFAVSFLPDGCTEAVQVLR